MIEVNPELAKKVAELVRQGETGQAVILLRKITQCSADEAQQYIESLNVTTTNRKSR